MTTKVTVENEANSAHTVRVVTVEYEKGKSGARDSQQQHVQPGQRAEFWVHALRDLRIEETDQ